MLLLHHVDVFISAKIMIFLEQNGIVFVLVEVQNCFKVLLVEIFLLKLSEDDIAFFGFSEPCQEHIEVVLYLLSRFGFNF